MNYRTVSELNTLLTQQISIIPQNVDLIVGVPRSGLLAASILSLRLHLPLTDVVGLCEGRIFQSGKRGGEFNFADIKRALVVDDSSNSGFSIASARKMIEDANLPIHVDFSAVYSTSEAKKSLDYYWEICEAPRVFEWNVMHHSVIECACVDIDGVLCRDPNEMENDDGENYIKFIDTVDPLVVPAGVINTLVTCRLEKYRNATEKWLRSAGIRYNELIMLDLPSGSARRKWGRYGEYKGEVYKKSKNRLFIESSLHQAHKIADISTKPVLATDLNIMVYPGVKPVVKSVAKRLPQYAMNKLERYKFLILKRLHPKSYDVNR